jgi:pimeloyl-ACP methyl ester carboxylesterase
MPVNGRRMAPVAAMVVSVSLVSAAGGPAAARTPHGHGSSTHGTTTTRPPSRTTTSTIGPPYQVRTESITFDDASRSTPARGSVPAKAGRMLVTDLYVPVDATGPLPLVVFAHGWDSDPGVYDVLLQRWAQAGFLVAAPVFPDSTDLYPGSPVSDYADQARDMSFVITSLLQSSGVDVDPHRIAVAGHSDGGTDVALLALDPAYADNRIHAYVSLSGEMPTGVDPFTPGPTPGSLFVAVGTSDEYGLYPLSTQVYQAAVMPKVLLTEQGGDHLGSFISDTPTSAAMREATVRFLHRALEPGPQSSEGLLASVEPTGSSLVLAGA